MFESWRLQAQAMPREMEPLRQAVIDEMWAHLGRRIYDNIANKERFHKAVMTACVGAEAAATPQAPYVVQLAGRIAAFLFTGTIA